MAKTWALSEDELKTPQNLWDKFKESVGIADNFRIHRLNLTSYRQRDTENVAKWPPYLRNYPIL